MKGTAAPSAVKWVGVSCSKFVSDRRISHMKDSSRTRSGTAQLAAKLYQPFLRADPRNPNLS